MKKLLLSVAILVGATLVLSQDKSDDLNTVTEENVASIQSALQAES
ncbi:hypothetical protein [Winogradskyella endarachnes]|uniref:Uncharacterized protein n=1 Tax=Winogradskyella endarachnes TaxID=2681965 RepID=A0A6L6U7D4_9FLAO|nr:hypothetical protein [Winogradskyella endarachnes]MUU78058.1 hypothetical protein [Winogradskyella endarachnes]